VKAKRFGELLQYFGPLDSRFLERIVDLLKSSFFHGDISQEDAERLLRNAKTGAYLVRFSSVAGCYTLSWMGKNNFEHHRIVNVPGTGVVVWSSNFKDIRAVIKEGKNKRYFSKHCAGSPYEYLFKKPVELDPTNYNADMTSAGMPNSNMYGQSSATFNK